MEEGARSLDEAAIIESGRGAWSDLAPHPVRRWVARQFDFVIPTALVLATLGSPLVLLSRSFDDVALPIGILGLVYLLGPIRGMLAAILNAVLLSRTATTVGKWLCGVRIVRKDGAPLTFGQAFRRELSVLALGCGLYLPLIALVAMIFHYFRLDEKGAASWDEGGGLVALQRPNSPRQVALTLLAFAPVVLAVLIGLVAAFAIAASRGAEAR
jgi:uncharacterized RDD family membrane protein YckC